VAAASLLEAHALVHPGPATPEGGLTQRLFAALRQQRPGSTFSNFAVPHATMGDVLRHQIPRLRGVQCDLVLLIAGANDLRYTGDRIVFARRLRHLITSLREAVPQALIIAGGMPDVTQTAGVPKLAKPAVARMCARLNETMREIAAHHADGFIDLFAYTSTPQCDGEPYLCADGYHPNDVGYAQIAQRSLPAILEVLRSLDTASKASPGDGRADSATRS
ncbi:MAG: SGNH/GDSL hydrolase family protein, partial [Candidatus Baltobacteraceae bacterium]